mgnify:CR=1 FL=1
MPTLGGAVELSIPKNTSSGRTFRLKGKGLPKTGGSGDLLAGAVRLDGRRAARADVDQERLMAMAGDQRGDEGMLFALGIKRAEDRDRGHGRFRRTYASPGSA